MKYQSRLIFAGGLLALVVAAEPIRSETLAEYLAMAEDRNLELEVDRLRWEGARAIARQAGRLPNPQLRYGYFGEAVETRVGPQRWKVGVSQALPWYGTRSLTESMAGERARAAGERYAERRRSLQFQITRWYHEYAYLASAIEVTRQNRSLIQRFEEIANTRLMTGGSLGEVIKIQIERSELDEQLLSLMERRDPLAAEFNAIVNHPQGTPVPWPAAVDPGAAHRQDPDLPATRLQENPTLRHLRFQVEHARMNRELMQKRRWPTVAVGVEYIDTGPAVAATDDSGKDPWIATIAMDLPLWRGNDRAAVAAADYQHQAAERLLDDQANRIENELRMAVYEFNDAERKLRLYDDTLVPQAGESLKLTEEGYRSGKQDILDLIDAERVLLRFKLERERMLADRGIARAYITQLAGEADP